MSVDMAKEFLARIATEQETAERAKGLAGAALVDLARQMGYAFSEQDLQDALAGRHDPSELAEDALDGVSGGLQLPGSYSNDLSATNPLDAPRLPRLDGLSGGIRPLGRYGR
jgi:predicted ribosomally synthesized peptide with nif11-like leader